MTITRRIAEFASDLTYERLPSAVVDKAKATLLHNLTVALAGTELTGHLRAYARGAASPDGGGARVWGTNQRTTPEVAAFVNAVTTHARTQDDVHFPSLTHIGSTVLPALLATAESRDTDGRSLLTAMVAGYEAAAAIGTGVAATTTARGFRASSLYGPFGAAAAVGRLCGLDSDRLTAALGLTAAFAGGTNQTWVAGTQEWMYEVAMAARNGLVAARLAELGATGADDALEGSSGFFASFAGEPDSHAEQVAQLGEGWAIEQVTFKPYPVCAINQVPVSVAIAAADRHDLDPQAIEAVRVHLSPGEAAYPGTDCIGPFIDVGATLMSAQFCLAIALRERQVRLTDLRRFNDVRVLDLVKKVTVVSDPDMAALSTRIEIDVAGRPEIAVGQTSTQETFNWDHAAVAELGRRLVPESTLDENQTEDLIALTEGIERHTVRELVDLITV